MKLIIDIDEKEYIGICEEPCTKLGLAIANGTLLEAQPTDEIKEAYLKGYDYGVKDWFKSKTQPCEDCISREEVRRILSNEVFELMKLHTVNPEDNPKADAMAYGVNWSLNTLMELPSVTPERPKGKWLARGVGFTPYECSECEAVEFKKSNYCPNCGAEMSGCGVEMSGGGE